jgi:hypothetical protein
MQEYGILWYLKEQYREIFIIWYYLQTLLTGAPVLNLKYFFLFWNRIYWYTVYTNLGENVLLL